MLPVPSTCLRTNKLQELHRPEALSPEPGQQQHPYGGSENGNNPEKRSRESLLAAGRVLLRRDAFLWHRSEQAGVCRCQLPEALCGSHCCTCGLEANEVGAFGIVIYLP